MKKLCLVLAMMLVFSSFFCVFASATEVDGGYIVLADENDARLVAAGDTLSKYMKQITGEDFSVSAEGDGMKFTLGYSAEIPDNGYVIKTAENEVSITGNGTSGVIYGVYGFLEKYCDCDWYTSTLYSIPENKNLTIPAGETTEYKPYFEYTDTDWKSPHDTEYSLANGLNGNTYRQIPSELGGMVEYISGFAHTLGSQFCSRDTYFESNPEYFALHNGIRQNEQLCLTNEDVYNLVLSEVMALLEEKHNPDSSLQIISLTQADSGENAKMCQCKNCKAIDDENGSHAGTMITFVNRIAKAVKDAGYDNVAIDTFAYRYTRKTPTKVVPAENVIVRLCTIECCFAHALDDTTCFANRELMADLEAWGKICDRIYVWDYTTNYAHTLGIFPNFGVIQKNIKIFYENNVVGIYEEGNYYMNECDGEFGELRSYLLSKLMQNPFIDFNKTMDAFLKAYYGNGWEYIREFIDIITVDAVPRKAHLSIYQTMGETLGFTKEDISNADELWENAKNAAETEEHLNNIKRSEISWRYWKGFNCYNQEENAKLIADIKAMGITKISEADTLGPDGLIFANERSNTVGNKVCFPIAIMLYFVAGVLSVAAMIIALIKKPRKFIYILLPILVGVYFELFGWHRRAYIGRVDTSGYLITLVLIFVLFAIVGALMTTGKKRRLISAVVCSGVWVVLYAILIFLYAGVITGNSQMALSIGLQYLLAGIEGVIMLVIMIKNLLKQKKNAIETQ